MSSAPASGPLIDPDALESGGPPPLLRVRDLRVDYGSVAAVRGVDFDVRAGQTVALVGESGSGKTTIGRAILGLHAGGVRLRGSIEFDGSELVGLRPRQMRRLRGRRIALIPQDPLAGLNPVHTIGRQVAETLRAHGLAEGAAARELAVQTLERAGLDDARERLHAYPHELSGGQRQRVLIAAALIAEPDLIVADEPTSALDVTVQRRILDHIDHLVRDSGAAMLLITHDLGVATDRADRVIVLSEGRLVEEVPARTFAADAQHPYTRRLAQAAPRMDSVPLVTVPSATPASVTPETSRQARELDSAPVLQVSGLTKVYPRPGRDDLRAVDGVDLTLGAGQSLGVVGESGSGKTTLARVILGLAAPDGGDLRIQGRAREDFRGRAQRKELHRLVQPVFQDPFSSLDPSHSVATSIAEPLRSLTSLPAGERRRRVLELLDRVHLPAAVARRRPDELSGGQLQRVAIARALAARPRVLVCDEPVSSLDVSIQAQILDLLAELHRESGVAYLFISHDLAVVRQICTDVVVMRHGRVVEAGPTLAVFDAPAHEYTRELLEAIPGQI